MSIVMSEGSSRAHTMEGLPYIPCTSTPNLIDRTGQTFDLAGIRLSFQRNQCFFCSPYQRRLAELGCSSSSFQISFQSKAQTQDVNRQFNRASFNQIGDAVQAIVCGEYICKRRGSLTSAQSYISSLLLLAACCLVPKPISSPISLRLPVSALNSFPD